MLSKLNQGNQNNNNNMLVCVCVCRGCQLCRLPVCAASILFACRRVSMLTMSTRRVCQAPNLHLSLLKVHRYPATFRPSSLKRCLLHFWQPAEASNVCCACSCPCRAEVFPFMFSIFSLSCHNFWHSLLL